MAFLTNYSFLIVLLGVSVLALASGILAVFLVLKKESLVADCISHATLPGVVLMFLIFNTKNSFLLLIGGMLVGGFAYYIINKIKKVKHTNFDANLAVILSSFFGLGLVLLTLTQKNPNAAQAGIRNIIFGQAAGITSNDVILMLIMCSIVVFITVLCYKEIKLNIFDAQFGQISGFNNNIIEAIFLVLTIIIVVLEIQIIGVILTATMLVSPALSSLQWSNNFLKVILLSCLFAIVSSVIGCIIAMLIPGLPTGPVICIVMGLITFFSIFFGKYGYFKTKIATKKLLKG